MSEHNLNSVHGERARGFLKSNRNTSGSGPADREVDDVASNHSEERELSLTGLRRVSEIDAWRACS
jgi:hypothetical protein